MDGRFFISYSRVDAAEFAEQLADRLVAGSASYSVWLDVRDEQPGTDWDNQIRDAIQACPGVLFLMTRDSVQDHSACKPEWVWALKYKKPVIPLRVDAEALENGHLPDDLGELTVDGIVYLSPAGAHPVSFPNLFADLCRVLPPETADRLLQRYRDPHETPTALMRALLDAVPSGRVVVLLDNAEDVIDAASGEFGITDAALDEALRRCCPLPRTASRSS